MAKKRLGRKLGGKNRGYFYRSGRGWYVVDGHRQVPLKDEDGTHIKDPKAEERTIREAHARWLLNRAAKPDPVSDITLVEVCQAYLANAKSNGAEKTHYDRADTLFDFCFGLPPKYRQKSGGRPKKLTAKQKAEMAEQRIHKGYGQMPVSKLRPYDIDQWLNAHSTWSAGGKRARIQAVKRALNYGVQSGLILKNPIRGYKQPKSRGRITYITPEQEQALCKHANPALRTAIRVCIRTGARFGSEFTKLTARHVTDHGDRMEWIFPPQESKTGRLRIIRITDPDILSLVRAQMKTYPGRKPIFRNTQGNPWKSKNLSQRFRFLKYRLRKKGIELDPDACMYSCRHTYAKRTLQGYWTGRPTNIETLARLMGNSPQVCRDHYLQWSEIDNEYLWDAT